MVRELLGHGRLRDDLHLDGAVVFPAAFALAVAAAAAHVGDRVAVRAEAEGVAHEALLERGFADDHEQHARMCFHLGSPSQLPNSRAICTYSGIPTVMLKG